jgi:tetratricopeptide (TPR) repeat protein
MMGKGLKLIKMVVLFSALCFGAEHSFAQSRLLDSLRKLLPGSADDTNKVKLLNNMSVKFRQAGLFDSSLAKAKASLRLAGQLSYQRGVARAYNSLGNTNQSKGNYDEALRDYNSAIRILKVSGDEQGIAMGYNNIGHVCAEQGNYPEALAYYFASLRIKEKLKDKKGIGISYSNIGNIYNHQGKYEEALANHRRALLYWEHADEQAKANSYNNMGNVYANMRDNEKAKENYIAALALQQKAGNKEAIASLYSNLGMLLYDQGKFHESLEKQEAALQLQEEIGERHGIVRSLSNLASVWLALRNYKQAEKYCDLGIGPAKEIQYIEALQLIYQTYSTLYKNTGRYEKGLEFYKEYIAAKDSLLNEENTKKSVRLEMQYVFDKKSEKEKLEREKKAAVELADKKKQRAVLFSVSGLLVFVMIFAGFAYRSNIQKKKANKAIILQKEIIELKQKEILDSIRYAKRIQLSLLTPEAYFKRNLSRLNKKR